MHDHLAALALTLFAYAALAISYFGWGSAAARVIRLTTSSAVMLIWLGWAVALLIFQVFHLYFPLNTLVVAPVFLIGIAFSISRARGLRLERGRVVRVAGLAIVIVIAAAWIASRSMLVPQVYDTGLYHLTTIRWINSFPIVPGLGNLHGRLAFNQSFFTYAASLNILGNGSRMANGFLFLLTATTFLARLRPVVVRPALLWEAHPFEYLPSLFALPILVHLAMLSPGLAAPTPDLATDLLQLVMFVMLAGITRRWLAGDDALHAETAILAILAATAITIKLSNLAFSFVVIAISLVLASRARVALPVIVATLIVWAARGYLSSGAPLYPSTIGYVAFDWAIPRDEVAQMAALIRGWAREPSENWRAAVANGTWLAGWFQRIRLYDILIAVPLVLGCCFIAAAGIVAAMRKSLPLRELLILFPMLAGLPYWYFTAPDPRFAHALFFCLAIAGALLFLAAVQLAVSRRNFSVILCAVFAITYGGLARQLISHRATIRQISLTSWQPIPEVPLIRKTTTSGLVILMPAKDEKCWDAPLPCTPYFPGDLRLRVPGQLESGFAVDEGREGR